MGIFALILGVLGGLCAVMGILTVVPVEPMPVAGFNEASWFSLAVILFLATIASLLTRGAPE